MTVDIQKFLSPFIEEQFPRHYSEEDKAAIVDFMEAFYEFVEFEADNRSMFLASRNMFDYRDIDTTLDSFIIYFREKYLKNLPYEFATDEEFAVKNIIDLYRSKGSEKAVKLLIRLLFNTNVDVYYPMQDVLRPSDSLWKEPRYLEVTRSNRTINFLYTRVTGSISGASGFVESIVTKRINGKLIDLIYISDIENGDFQTGEIITNNGNIVGAPTLIGSLRDISIIDGNAGYSIGDRLDVVSVNGIGGVAKVASVFDVNDSVNFDLTESGFGYSLEYSDVLISDAILFVNNLNLDFENYETITQNLSQFTVSSANGISVGDDVVAYDSANTEVGTGFIVASSPTEVTIETVTGDLKTYQEITLANPNLLIDGEEIKEGSNYTLAFNNLSGSFNIGETLLQRELVNGAYVNIAYGTLASTGASTLFIENAWGTFSDGQSLEGLTSGATADITSATITTIGAIGNIISSNSTVIEVLPTYGEFAANNDIRGEQSKNINTISSVSFTGTQSIDVANTTFSTSNFADVTASGILIGQLNNRIGVHGNTSPFYFTTGKTNLLSSSYSALSREILRVGNGSGANFELGTLNSATQETVTIKTDIIGEENIAGVPYTEIIVGTAEESGVGRISNTVTIVDGGTGYANSDIISLSGGGYANGTPIIAAEAEIVTNGAGVITAVNILDQGQGYYISPVYSISGTGTGADLTFTIEYGYGFPKLPFGTFDDIIDDVLETKTTTIGEIATLKNINRGSSYDTNIFVKVINNDILEFDIEDISVTFVNNIGTFIEGEIVTAPSGAEGRIETVSGNTIRIKNMSFETRFAVSDVITGQSTNSTATISFIAPLFDEDDMAENAVIDSRVAFAEGIIKEISIIDSGYGHIDGESLTLVDKGTDTLAANGTAIVNKQGVAEGFWKTRTSHLNEQVIHDNNFYQEYSYEVQAGVSFDKYETIVRNVIHTAGTELFGSAYLIGTSNVAVDSTSTISRGFAVEYTSEIIESPNIANTLYTTIYALDPTNSLVGRLDANIVINDGGTGYSNTSTITFTGGGAANSEPTTTAQATITTDGSGSIISIDLVNRGGGYVEVPDFTISDGANANVVFAIEYGYGFQKNPYASLDSIIGNTLGFGEINFQESEVLY